jgi:hypothetical protein
VGTTALVLLLLWAIGLLGPYELGPLVHIPFIAGFMLLLLTAAKTREAAVKQHEEELSKPATPGTTAGSQAAHRSPSSRGRHTR